MERQVALEKKATRVGQLIDDRSTGKLEENFMWIAQAMILCTLPYCLPAERSIVRRARLGDGSTLTVTFTACIDGVALPFGSDRRLLFWLFDKAIHAKSPVITWGSARQYQDELGLSHGGRDNRRLRESFRRLAGLNVNIERRGSSGTCGMNRSIFEDYFLPQSISGFDDSRQAQLEGIDRPYIVQLHRKLFDELVQGPIAVPRLIWSDLQGSAQVQDLVLWLYMRCYAARSESLIPWDALSEQFSRDSNVRRQKGHAEEAVLILRRLWPGVKLELTKLGLRVDKPSAAMFSDRSDRRRLSKAN